MYRWARGVVNDKYAKLLLEQEIDGEVLLTMTCDQFQSIDMPVEPAEKLVKGVEALGGGQNNLQVSRGGYEFCLSRLEPQRLTV